MPTKLRIDDSIEFRNTRGVTVKGIQQELLIHDQDRFTGIALDTTNRWAISVPGTSDSIAISETAGGSALMTTGTADNDSCMLSSAIIWNGDTLSVVEFRLTITDVSGTAVFVGFTDAKSEANGQIAFQYPADSFTSTADSGAGFVIDADHSSSLIRCVSSNATTDTTPVSTTVTHTDGQTNNYRVILDTDGVATFVLDGVVRAKIASSVPEATLLCATVQAMTRAADGSNTVRVHQYDAWANRT